MTHFVHSAAAIAAARAGSDAMAAKLAAQSASDAAFVAAAPSNNPWLKRHKNLTNQMRLLKLNPELAASLRDRAASEEGAR